MVVRFGFIVSVVSTFFDHCGEEVTAQLMNNFSGKTSGSNPADVLTKREKEFLTLIAQGLTEKEIAGKIFLSSLNHHHAPEKYFQQTWAEE